MTWIFILPLFKFWKQKGKGLSFLYIPQRRRRRRKKIIYRRLRNCWKRSTRWATSETGPGDLLLHDRKTPNGCCLLLLMVFLILFSAAVEGGAEKKIHDTLQVVCVTTAHNTLVLWQLNTNFDDSHTETLVKNFQNETKLLLCHDLSQTWNVRRQLLMFWQDRCPMPKEHHHQLTMLFCAGLISE